MKTDKVILIRLEDFRAKLQNATIDRLTQIGYGKTNHRTECKIKLGRKYANVDVGDSGRYMVELSTGNIYGIKAYGVIHRGHQYGNLETTDDFYWGEYAAIKKPQVKTNPIPS